jgi:hypothetical protein
LHSSLSTKSSFYLPAFEIARSCRTAPAINSCVPRLSRRFGYTENWTIPMWCSSYRNKQFTSFFAPLTINRDSRKFTVYVPGLNGQESGRPMKICFLVELRLIE